MAVLFPDRADQPRWPEQARRQNEDRLQQREPGAHRDGDEAALQRQQTTAVRQDHGLFSRAGVEYRSPLSFTTSPPFITKGTACRMLTSASGSPATAIRSPNRPAAIAPTSPERPSASAAVTVAAWIACMGVMPQVTIVTNCLALSPF